MRRFLLALMLACTACSWDEEKPTVFIHVNGVPATADHLDVTMTLPDASTKTFHPSFQPQSLSGGAVDLAFTAAGSGTVSFVLNAFDRSGTQLATGTTSGTVPGPANLQVTLH